MKDILKQFEIIENIQVSSRTWRLRLRGDVSNIQKAGQFVNVEIPGKYLRRPISVNRYFPDRDELILLYNIAGEGTLILSELKTGFELNILSGLGNGFSIPENINRPILLGGGIGSAPLMQLAVDLVENGKLPQVILGYNTSKESWGMEDELRQLGISAFVSTMDGSKGEKGIVTDIIRKQALTFDYFYACGPMPMLQSLQNLPVEGELSLECRMGCGFGACMCCSLEILGGSKRICKDGPVFKKGELLWK